MKVGDLVRWNGDQDGDLGLVVGILRARHGGHAGWNKTTYVTIKWFCSNAARSVCDSLENRYEYDHPQLELVSESR